MSFFNRLKTLKSATAARLPQLMRKEQRQAVQTVHVGRELVRDTALLTKLIDEEEGATVALSHDEQQESQILHELGVEMIRRQQITPQLRQREQMKKGTVQLIGNTVQAVEKSDQQMRAIGAHLQKIQDMRAARKQNAQIAQQATQELQRLSAVLQEVVRIADAEKAVAEAEDTLDGSLLTSAGLARRLTSLYANELQLSGRIKGSNRQNQLQDLNQLRSLVREKRRELMQIQQEAAATA